MEQNFDDYLFSTFYELIFKLQTLSLMNIILKSNFEVFSFEDKLKSAKP